MATVSIQSVLFCNRDEEPFEYDEENDIHFVPFRPKTKGGTTGEIFLRAGCRVEPATGSRQCRFSLELFNVADFQFAIGIDNVISYVRQVSNSGIVFLKLEIINRRLIKECHDAEMMLYSRDSLSNSLRRQRRIYIKGF